MCPGRTWTLWDFHTAERALIVEENLSGFRRRKLWVCLVSLMVGNHWNQSHRWMDLSTKPVKRTFVSDVNVRSSFWAKSTGVHRNSFSLAGLTVVIFYRWWDSSRGESCGWGNWEGFARSSFSGNTRNLLNILHPAPPATLCHLQVTNLPPLILPHDGVHTNKQKMCLLLFYCFYQLVLCHPLASWRNMFSIGSLGNWIWKKGCQL